MSKDKEIHFFGRRAEEALQWEDAVTHKDWFEKELVLLDGVERGSFRVDTAPHTEDVLEDADKPEVNRITLMWASQTTKTTLGIGILFKNIGTSYDNGFVMFPTANSLPKMVKFKFKPQLKGCEVLTRRIEDYSQDEGDRKNSFIYNTGRNLMAVLSTVATKSITARWMVFDECAEMDIAVVNEAEERAKTFTSIGYKSVRTSTQIHPNDAINHSFLTSEVKKRRYVPCPKCSHLFYPLPKDFKFRSLEDYKAYVGRAESEEVPHYEIMADYVPFASQDPYLECPECNYRISDEERIKMILEKKLVWKQVKPTQKDDEQIVYEIVPEEDEKDTYRSVGFDINTMCIHNVPMAEFVRKTIECQYGKPHEKDALFDKFYVGYWNIIYTPSSAKKVIKNDILLLSHGYGDKIVPPDTHALHLGVDLQKDRLYYKVNAFAYGEDMILKTVEYGELYSDGVGNDFKALREIIGDTFYDPDGKPHFIRSVGIDIRGFSLKDKESRSNEALDFIFDYAEDLKYNGVVDWDKFIYPMMGEDKLEARYEIQGYKTRPRQRDDDTGEVTKINDIVFSNLRIKNILFNMMERGIKKAKAEPGEPAETYDRMLYYINEEAVRQAEERSKLPSHEQRSKHSLEAHLTSEHLTYKILSTGKPAKEQSYEKKYDGVRNDWLDCDTMTIAQALLLDTYRTPLPKEETGDNSDYLDKLSKAIL